MISEEEVKRFGSTNLSGWMKECTEIIEKDFKPFYKKDTSVFHVYPTDIETFKKQVESYAKAHPGAKIRASGFMISTEK